MRRSRGLVNPGQPCGSPCCLKRNGSGAERLQQRRSNFLLTLGRLAPGATVQSAEAEMRRLFANLGATYPDLSGENVRVAPLHSESMQSVRQPLLLVFGAVFLVLLIAATNVAALLLAMIGAAMLAAFIPARRAARVDPIAAIQME